MLDTTKTSIYASFEVIGTFDPDALTRAIELEPTRTWRAGTRIGTGPAFRKVDGWALKTTEAEGYDLGTHIRELLELVMPHSEAIRSFVAAHEVGSWVYGVSMVRDSAPFLGLASETLRSIAELGATLDVDFYVPHKGPTT